MVHYLYEAVPTQELLDTTAGTSRVMDILLEGDSAEADDYKTVKALIFDHSESLVAYVRDTLETDEQKAAAEAYTEGYAIQFYIEQSAALSSSDFTVGGCVGGIAVDSNGENKQATSCVSWETTWAEETIGETVVATPTNTYTSYYAAGTNRAMQVAEGQLEVVTMSADYDGLVTGFDKTWWCINTSVHDLTVEYPTETTPTSCTRYLPKYTGEYAEDDLRFDSDVTGQLGHISPYGDTIQITWVSADAGLYGWNSAAQVASLVGAAALAALAF